MKGTSKLFGGLVLLALVAAVWAPVAGAKAKPRIAGTSQKSILKHGVKVKLPGGGGGPVGVGIFSTTFDQQKPKRLTRKATLDPGESGRLRLTKKGRRQIRSCEARTLILRSGAGRATAQLKRTTSACSPKPVDLSRAGECDFIGQQGGSRCLLPFPDDYYTSEVGYSASGRQINLKAGAMPRNIGNTPIDPSPYSGNDGFSPGSTILLRIPGLDNPGALQQTGAAPINHIGRYAEDNQPVVVIDAATGKRWPIWTELDSNATSDSRRVLEIHPAVNFASGHNYLVALRGLKTAAGAPIPAPEGFRYYRDALPSSEPAINARRQHFETLFQGLRRANIRRSNLYLAWDFTVASDENIAARALHMRDDAFGVLGDTDMDDLTVTGNAPAFNVVTVDNFSPAQDSEIARRVRGTFTVPCYMQPNCDPGGSFQLDSNGLPQRNGNYTANFDCVIPRSAIDGPTPTPGRPSVYGHGLFGAAAEVFQAQIQNDLANTYGFVMCATDEIGMSGNDVNNTLSILNDLSKFPQMADRLQQGLLNELFLGRLMFHPQGLLSSAAFHTDGVSTASPGVIDPSQVYYQGSSQGGIMGGALTALAPDFTRSVLNVPAMNYSVLLPRSVDYDQFATFVNIAYTDEMTRPLIFDLIQMLWDRGEPNGYAHRMTTNPLANTPAHTVLMNVALGDHQVTNFQADVEARTIGASTHVPILYPGRWPDVDVLWNVPPITSYPFTGSAVVYGDIGPVRPNLAPPPTMIGVPPPPLENVPNRAGEDPHGAPRGAPLLLQAISEFLKPNGAVVNVCGAGPCFAGGFTGP
jgi:hypothetical protein